MSVFTPNPQHEIRSLFIHKIRAPAPLTWMWTTNSWKLFKKQRNKIKLAIFASSLNLVFYRHFSGGPWCNWKAKSTMPLHNCTALSSAPKYRDDLIKWKVGKLTIVFKHLNYKLKLYFEKCEKQIAFLTNRSQFDYKSYENWAKPWLFESGFYP